MKAVKIIGIIVGVIVIILAIVITMQPSEAHLEKSIIINAPPSAIFPQVSNFKNFIEWDPWSKMDPEVKHTFKGTEGTVGSRMDWEGPEISSGSQWIEEIDENKRVKFGMTFSGFDGKFQSEFLLEPQGDFTRVTWTYDGPNAGLSGKAMWVIIGPMLGGQYDEGLRTLKKRVESRPVQ